MSNLPIQPSDGGTGSPVRYAQAIRQHWLLIASVVGLSVAVTVVALQLVSKRYEASADVAINPISATDANYQGFSVFRQGLDGSSAVVAAARAFSSPAIRGPAMAAADPDKSGGVSVDVAPVTQASVVTVTATAPTGPEAAAAANAFARTAVAKRAERFQAELEATIARLRLQISKIPPSQRDGNFEYAALGQRLGELQGLSHGGDPTLGIASAAVTPSEPSWPRPFLTLAAVVLASLLLGLAIAVLMELANPRISREDELRREQRLPILARVPRISQRMAKGYLQGRNQLDPGTWKGYRALRASIAAAGPEGSFPRSILITSATPGDGKTMTAVNLSIALATTNLRVVLVDADVHRPMVATFFKAGGQHDGFVRSFATPASTESQLVSTLEHPRLRLLLARPEHHAQSRFLDSQRVAEVLEHLYRLADVVVIDAPPITEVAETIELAAQSELVVIAARLGHTRRDKLNQLREMLARRGISPAGFVVTTRDRAEPESPYDHSGAVVEEPRRSEGPRAVKDGAQPTPTPSGLPARSSARTSVGRTT